jgi:hypothetical protein
MTCNKNLFIAFLSSFISIFLQAQEKNTIELYGYTMLDAGYNFQTIDPQWFDVMRPTKLPSYKGEFGPEGQVYYSVRQTKFGIKSNTFFGKKELKTQFDFDLFGFGQDAGQTTFHLVNAYAQLGKFGAGQTASVFMDMSVFPVTLDYWGPASRVFFLNIQVRYIPIEKEFERLIISLERPGATSDGSDYAQSIELARVKPYFNVPNLVVHYRNGGNWGYVQAGAIAKSIKWKDTSASTIYDLSGSAVAWGLNLSTVFTTARNIQFKIQGVYGSGIENYIADASVDIGRESNPGDPSKPVKGKPLPVAGLFTFAEINWRKNLRSSVGFSLIKIKNSDLQSAEAFRRGKYGLVNLRYYPVENTMIGIEYQYGRRDAFDQNFHAVANKLQVSFKFMFSKVFASE